MAGENRTVPLLLLSVLYEECLKRRNQTADQTTESSVEEEDTDFGAVMYISTVLVFYSAGIVVMIIKYLKTEKQEMEEEAALDNFFKHMPDTRTQQEDHVNKVAIQAFHTLTTSTYDGDRGDNCSTRPPSLLVSDV